MAINWPWQKKQIVAPPPSRSDAQIQEEFISKAKDILLKEGYSISNVEPHLRRVAEQFKNLRSSFQYNEYHIAAAFAAIYTKLADTRAVSIQEVDKIRSFYLTDVIIDQLKEDALAPEMGTNKVLAVICDKENIQKEIDALDEKFDFNQIALTIAPDMIAYGEYTLSTRVKQNPDKIKVTKTDDPTPEPGLVEPMQKSKEEYGLLDIKDDVEQATVVALTNYSEIQNYIVKDTKGKMYIKEPADYIKFSLGNQRLRIDLYKEFALDPDDMPEELKDIPRFVRVGKSPIYTVLSKLKELELLEALVPATKLNKLSQGTLIGVQVPAAYDIEQAINVVQKVEGLINKKLGVDTKLGELTIQNMLNTAGATKCVPIFGDKGQLSKMDYKADEPDELLATVRETREVICDSIGVPYDIIFGGGEGNKGEILKKYSRYLRKLRAIQRAVEEGVKQIVYIHLSNKGINYEADDIKVEFLNKLVEVDNLDKLEFVDTTISMLKNVVTFMTELADPNLSPIADKVRLSDLLVFLNKQLDVIGFNNVIDVDGDGRAEGGFEGPVKEPRKLNRRVTPPGTSGMDSDPQDGYDDQDTSVQ